MKFQVSLVAAALVGTAWAGPVRTARAGHLIQDRADIGPDLSDIGSALFGGVIATRTKDTTQHHSKHVNCKNTDSRQCWGGNYSAETDPNLSWPDTGKVKKYHLEITNTTIAPDGFERIGFQVNGQIPGPTIFADWGDTLEITVTNKLQNNGTSIHWHGLRQLNSNIEDGANGVTECPIAPGQTKTYRFKCTQFGTSWYHSHYSAQYADGLFGSIIINGPASMDYDEDLGTLTINEWTHLTAFQTLLLHNDPLRIPPFSDNGLINGTMVSPDGKSGAYHRTKITKGKTYRLRLINTGGSDSFLVGLDRHKFTVISADFVPMNPVEKDWVFLGPGQRHDVVFTARDPDGTGLYWLRAEPPLPCSLNKNKGNIRSIFQYPNANANGIPRSIPAPAEGIPLLTRCLDTTDLVPYVPNNVPKAEFAARAKDLDVRLTNGPSLAFNQTVVYWTVNGVHMAVDWKAPTVEYVANGRSFPRDASVILLDEPNVWTFWVIQQAPGQLITIPHPIHLHGHDFSVLGQGFGQFSNSMINKLEFENPTRRDTAMLPAGGWLVIAFETDNPGAWLMHCHIAYHVSQGLSVQFVERRSEMVKPPPAYYETCHQWNEYYNQTLYKQEDSGI